MDMRRINERDQHVDIEQRSHRLDVVVEKLSDEFRRHRHVSVRKLRYVVAHWRRVPSPGAREGLAC